MVLLFALITGIGLADPVALRAPAASWSLVTGAPTMSAGYWTPSDWGAAVSLQTRGSAVGGFIGHRWVQHDRPGWGLENTLAGGVLVPLIDPGVALNVTPTIRGRWRGERVELGLALTVPSALQFIGGFDARLPILLEPTVSIAIGKVQLGVLAGIGVGLFPGQAPTLQQEIALLIAGNPRRP